MSTTMRELSLSVSCSYCGAGPTDPCISHTGKRATYPHAARWRVVQPIWMDGYQEGQRDVLMAVDHAHQWGAGYLDGLRKNLKEEKP